jgi:phosphopantothenoylcysteine decarboxylase
VLIAPAMNGKMWLHPATQRNVTTLKGDGVHFIAPATGDLACGYQGVGRLAELADILAAVDQIFPAS